MYEQGYEAEEPAIGSGGLARFSLRALAEGVVSESTGFAPPPGYERVALSELLKDD